MSAVTRYLYDGMLVVQERDGSNNPLVGYTRGLDLSGTFEGAGGIGLLARSHGYSGGTWSTHNLYHADGLGNVTFMLDSGNQKAAAYKYDAYGRTISSSGSLSQANLYRFSSKEIHANSGFYYYGFRFYDPNSQRWLNRDPIAELGGLNIYVPVANAPTTLVDPIGLDYYVLYITASSGAPHQVVIGDNGVGGSYTLEYGPAGGGLNRITGPGKYTYFPFSFPPCESGYDINKAHHLKTSAEIDRALNAMAAALGENRGTPNYCVVGKNCWATAPLFEVASKNLVNFGSFFSPINTRRNLPPQIATQ